MNKNKTNKIKRNDLWHRREYYSNFYDEVCKGKVISDADIIVKEAFQNKYGWNIVINFWTINNKRKDCVIRRSELMRPDELLARLYDEGLTFCDDPKELCNFLLSFKCKTDDA